MDESVHDELVDDFVGDYLMHDLASELAARTIRQVGPQPLAAEMGMAGVPLVSQRITSFLLCQEEFRRCPHGGFSQFRSASSPITKCPCGDGAKFQPFVCFCFFWCLLGFGYLSVGCRGSLFGGFSSGLARWQMLAAQLLHKRLHLVDDLVHEEAEPAVHQ